MTASWYLSDIGRAVGVQELFTRQSPQRLKVLREHAVAQSVVSSNRIEGVEIDQKRVATVIFGHPALQDRDEIEVAGYRDALNLVHGKGRDLPVDEETISKVFPSAKDIIHKMVLEERYKDVTFETLNRPDFLESVQYAFPRINWDKAYNEFKAAGEEARVEGTAP